VTILDIAHDWGRKHTDLHQNVGNEMKQKKTGTKHAVLILKKEKYNCHIICQRNSEACSKKDLE
jgi:hypothetical protein